MQTISKKGQLTLVIRLDRDDEFDVIVRGKSFRVFEVRASIRETGMASLTLRLRSATTRVWAVPLAALPAGVQAEIQRGWTAYRDSLPALVIDQENEGRLVAATGGLVSLPKRADQ